MSDEAKKEPTAENKEATTEGNTVENTSDAPKTAAPAEEKEAKTEDAQAPKEEVSAETESTEAETPADNSPKGWLGVDAKIKNGQLIPLKEIPVFNAGDTITVHYKIIEGSKQRIQAFKGDILQVKGTGATKTFTIRKISNGVGVERIIPLFSPAIDKIEVNKRGKVRRAKIFYLRELKGKKAKIKEKRS